MNCEDCLALLDDYNDETLSRATRAAVKNHLELCQPCQVFQQDLTVILNSCVAVQEHLEAPPNAQALWLRISNTIECEQQTQVLAEAKSACRAARKIGWWTRTMETSWKLSLQQMVSAVLGVAVVASLLTVIAVQNRADFADANTAKPGAFWSAGRNQPVRRIEIENRVKQQQQAIDYWNRRVATRRNQWNPNLRSAFDRNLHEIDQVVADYQEQLQSNPEDNISEEMLDSALQDKMQLLREFSEL